MQVNVKMIGMIWRRLLGCVRNLTLQAFLVIVGVGTILANQSGDYGFTLTDNASAIITNCTSTSGNVSVPEAIDGYPVVDIGASAFARCSNLTFLTLPNSVTNLATNAFSGCFKLKSLTLGMGLMSIGDNALSECTALRQLLFMGDAPASLGNALFATNSYARVYHVADSTGWGAEFQGRPTALWAGSTPYAYRPIDAASVEITEYLGNDTRLTMPDSIAGMEVAELGKASLSSYPALVSVTLPSRLKRINDEAFFACNRLTNVVFPDGLLSIGSRAFVNCVKLDQVMLPDSVTNLGAYAFMGCSYISQIHLPAGLPTLPNHGFSGCGSLHSLTWPSALTLIDDFAFSDCNGLENLIFPESALRLGNSTFASCKALRNLVLGDNIVSLGSNCFAHCNGLTNVVIGKGLLEIPLGAFSQCSGLKSVTVGANVAQVGESAFSDCWGLKSVQLPAGLSNIAHAAFSGCRILPNLELPDGLVSLGDKVFSGCWGLTNVYLPNSITNIGASAFQNCTHLASLQLPKQLVALGTNAFEQCSSLEMVTFPGTLRSISADLFTGCDLLSQLVFEGDAPSLAGGNFQNATNLAVYYYPGKSGWETTFGGGKTYIYDVPIYTYELLTPETIAITNYYGASGNIAIPGTIDGLRVTCLRAGAFAYGSNVTSVSIPSSVTNIESGALSGFAELTNITVHSQNPAYQAVDGVLFSKDFATLVQFPLGCGGSYVIPNLVSNIAPYAFAGSAALTNLFVTSGVKMIGERAFANCPILYSIYFTGLPPETVAVSALDQSYSVSIYYARGYVGLWSSTLCGHWATSAYLPYQDYTVDIAYPDRVTIIRYAGQDAQLDVPEFIFGLPVTSFYYSAFFNCTNLVDVTLPSTVTELGLYVFDGSKHLLNITVDAQNPKFSSCEGILYDKGQTTLLRYPQGRVGEDTLPNSVTTIGVGAFRNCTRLTGFIAPPNLNRIRNDAFRGCSGMTHFDLNPGLAIIEYQAFYGCTGLSSLSLPEKVSDIGPLAFYGCASLSNITVSPLNTKYSDINGVLFSKDQMGLILYPSGKTDTSYSVPESVTFLQESAFSGCASLATITLPINLGVIVVGAFAECPGLRSVYCEGNCPFMVNGYPFDSDNHATVYYHPYTTGWNVNYWGCPTEVWETEKSFAYELLSPSTITITHYDGLSSRLAVPSTIDGLLVTGLRAGAFAGSTNLTSIILPASLTSIEAGAFAGCTSLTNLSVNSENPMCQDRDGVLFSKDLTTLICYPMGRTGSYFVPDGVTTIGERAFSGCSGLTSVSVAKSVVRIGDYAFSECSRLELLFFQGNAPELLGPNTFASDSLTHVRYYEDRTGWSAAFGGLPTAAVPPFSYESDGLSGIAITGYLGESESVVVPASIDGFPIVGIRSNAFASGYRLKSIELPDTLAYIDSQAFYGCSNLTSLALGTNVTRIGASAFYQCTGLQTFALPSSLASIGANAFYGCTGLTSLTFSSQLVALGEGAFSHCSGLESVILPGSLTNIGAFAFSDCLYLNHLELNKGTTNIGRSAFSGCQSLSSVTLPESLVDIGSSSFYGCSSMTNFTMGGHVTNVGAQAFYGCTELTSLTLSSQIVVLGSGAFSYCTGLQSVILPGSLADISAFAFYNCSSLSHLELNEGINQIGESAFSGCQSLKSVTLPESLVDIGSSSFYGCSSLTNFTMGGRLDTIGTQAFYGCPGLTQLAFGTNVTRIGPSAFYQCTGLQSLALPSSLASIGTNAFYGCTGLTSLTLGSQLVTLEKGAFSHCTGLQSVILPGSLADIGAFAFSSCSSLSQLELNEGTIKIGESAFMGCQSLRSLTFPESLVNIGPSSFHGCSSLTNLSLGTRVVSIGVQAFFACSALPRLSFPKSLENLESAAFLYCSGLTNISVDPQNAHLCDVDGVVFTADKSILLQYPPGRMGDYAVPNSVTRIADYAFATTQGLTDVRTGLGTVEVAYNAFVFCSGLRAVTFGKSINSLGTTAFAECRLLSEVNFLGAPPTVVGQSVFANDTSAVIYYVSGTPGWGMYFAGVPTVSRSGWPLFTYTYLGSNSIAIAKYNGTNADVTVPPSIDGMMVTTIGRGAFAGCASVTNISLPQGISSLESGAFADCTGLVKVVFSGNAPTTVAAGLFTNSPQALVYYMPDTTGWGSTFAGRPTTISVDSSSFHYLVNSNATICITGYSGPLNRVIIPDYLMGMPVVSIGDHAFFYGSTITNIQLPASLRSIGYEAFASCSGLTSLTLPDNLTSLGGWAFAWCTGLTNITIPSLLSRIGEGAFASCVGLANITIPEGVTSLGEWAFSNCQGLGSVFFPASLVEIGDNTFSTSYDLTNFVVAEGNQVFSTRDGVLFDKQQKLLKLYPPSRAGAYEVPGSVQQIASYAFYECGQLAHIILPNGVTNLGTRAFYHCSALTNLILPDSVVKIGAQAFAECGQIKTIRFSENLSLIGSNAFNSCTGLETIDLPGSVVTIQDFAFGSCTSLGSVTLSTNVADLGSNVFFGCTQLTNISVAIQNASFSDQTGVLFNKQKSSLIQYPLGRAGYYRVPAGVATLAPWSFAGGVQLTNLALPDEVTHIGAYALGGCASLTSILMPEGVVAIDDGAFSGCTNLTALYFRGNAPVLTGERTFYVTNGVSQVTVYYLPGTTGWGTTFGGRPTALWVPSFQQWTILSGLANQYPEACGEQDDPDHDGLSNLQEMMAGTNPTSASSALAFEAVPRLSELSAEDQSPISADHFALYFQSVPGKTYVIESCEHLGSGWANVATVTTTTTQKRVVLAKPANQAFYRVLVQQ